VRARPIAGTLALFATIFFFAENGSAFCRTTTCHNCAASAGGCVTEGAALFWPSSCVSHSVQQDATKWANLAETTRVVNAAFDAWTAVLCPGTSQGPSIKLVDIGPVACRAPEFNSGEVTIGGNANIVVFNDDTWPVAETSTDPESTLALTTVTYDKSTGQILDADIRVNGQNVLSTSAPVPSNAYDMQSLLTHEVGHFIGLAHSAVPCTGPHDCPTMHALYPKGDDSFRTLEVDDVAGACAVYPPGRASDTTCIPIFGFSGECGIPVNPDGRAGCQLARGTVGFSTSSPAILGAIAAAWLRRKREQRPEPRRRC
jgi:hypothetical protein